MAVDPTQLFATDQTDADGKFLDSPSQLEGVWREGLNQTNSLLNVINFGVTSSDAIEIPVWQGRARFGVQAQQGAKRYVSKVTGRRVNISTKTYYSQQIMAKQALREALEDPRKFINRELTDEVGLKLEAEMLGIYEGDSDYTSSFGFVLKSLATGGGARVVTWDPATGLWGYRQKLIEARKANRPYGRRGSFAAIPDVLEDSVYLEELTTTVNELEDGTEDVTVTGTNTQNQGVFSSVAQLFPGGTVSPTANLVDPEEADTGDVIGVVGDGSAYAVRIREGLRQEFAKEATVYTDDPDHPHGYSLFGSGSVGVQHEFDAGGGVLDANAFTVVVKG